MHMNRQRRLPAALRPGDVIGIVSPSGPIAAKTLEKGVDLLIARGYRVKLGAHVLDCAPGCDYLAGTDAHRASDINALFADDSVAALFCSRGGYGAMRLLDRIDLDVAAASPKIVLGYSDITALHVALNCRAGLTTFYGPVLAAIPNLSAQASEALWRMLESPEPAGALSAGDAAMAPLVSGIAEGELAGGCLSLLAHLCGSDETPDFREKIVLLEDVNESIYRVDRYLMQLLRTGRLHQAAGFVLGTVSRWRHHEPDPPRNHLETLWRDFFVPLGKPTLVGLPFGHEPNPLTLPIGVRARLDADARTLTLLEPATFGRDAIRTSAGV